MMLWNLLIWSQKHSAHCKQVESGLKKKEAMEQGGPPACSAVGTLWPSDVNEKRPPARLWLLSLHLSGVQTVRKQQAAAPGR